MRRLPNALVESCLSRKISLGGTINSQRCSFRAAEKVNIAPQVRTQVALLRTYSLVDQRSFDFHQQSSYVVFKTKYNVGRSSMRAVRIKHGGHVPEGSWISGRSFFEPPDAIPHKAEIRINANIIYLCPDVKPGLPFWSPGTSRSTSARKSMIAPYSCRRYSFGTSAWLATRNNCVNCWYVFNKFPLWSIPCANCWAASTRVTVWSILEKISVQHDHHLTSLLQGLRCDCF